MSKRYLLGLLAAILFGLERFFSDFGWLFAQRTRSPGNFRSRWSFYERRTMLLAAVSCSLLRRKRPSHWRLFGSTVGGRISTSRATSELVAAAKLEKAALVKEMRATFGVPPGIDASRPAS